jgi:hypothetical protein
MDVKKENSKYQYEEKTWSEINIYVYKNGGRYRERERNVYIPE